MNRWLLTGLAALILATFLVNKNLERHRAVRQQIRMAYGAVGTAVHSGGTSELVAADLEAHRCIDAINLEDARPSEIKAARAMAQYLAAFESVENSHSVETTALRGPALVDAGQKLDEAFRPFELK